MQISHNKYMTNKKESYTVLTLHYHFHSSHSTVLLPQDTVLTSKG